MSIVNIKPISVVIVTYNSSNTIKRLLNSLTNSVNLLENVIVIDNNSKDKELLKKIVNQIVKKISLKIKLIQNDKNLGFAKACNLAVKSVKTRYVLFINPDTYVQNNSLNTLLNHAEISNADLIGGICQKTDKSYHRTIVRDLNLIGGIFELTSIGKFLKTKIGTNSFYHDLDEYNSANDFNVGAISGAYLMVKTESFCKLGGFDERYFMYLEDVDLGYRARCLGMNIVFCPHSKITHIGGASSNNKHKINYHAWSDSRKKYFLKNHNFLINIAIQPIFAIEDILINLKNYISK